MGKRLNAQERVRLDKVREEFARWRAGKKERDPIPDRLWRSAAGLVGAIPITVVGRELSLESSKFKRHFEELRRRRSSRRPRKSRRTTFVEVSAPSAPSVAATDGVAIELERPDGARLRLSTEAMRGLDLAGLLSRFSAGSAIG